MKYRLDPDRAIELYLQDSIPNTRELLAEKFGIPKDTQVRRRRPDKPLDLIRRPRWKFRRHHFHSRDITMKEALILDVYREANGNVRAERRSLLPALLLQAETTCLEYFSDPFGRVVKKMSDLMMIPAGDFWFRPYFRKTIWGVDGKYSFDTMVDCIRHGFFISSNNEIVCYKGVGKYWGREKAFLNMICKDRNSFKNNNLMRWNK